MANSYYDYARIIGDATVSTTTEDFEDDIAGLAPEGWDVFAGGGSGVSAVEKREAAVTSNSISGSLSGVTGSSIGWTLLENDADTGEVSLTFKTTLNRTGSGPASGFGLASPTDYVRTHINADTGDVLYTNSKEGVNRKIVKSGVYTEGEVVDMSIRGFATGIEIVYNGSVVHSTSHTFTSGNRVQISSDDQRIVVDDVTFTPSGSNLYTDPEFVETSDLTAWWPTRQGKNSFLPNYGTTSFGYMDGTSWATDDTRGTVLNSSDSQGDQVRFLDDGFQERTFTTTMWIKLHTKPGSPGAYGIFMPEYDGTVHPPHIRYDNGNRTNGEGFILRMYDNGTGDYVGPTSSISTGTWHHLAVSLDWSTGDVEFHIDGTLDTTGNLGLLKTNSKKYTLGNGRLDASIDSIRNYTSVLTTTQINNIISAEQ